MCKVFPFKSIPYKTYRNTFLQSVLIKLDFKPIDKKTDSAFDQRLSDFIQATFGLDLEDNTSSAFWEKGISISKADNLAHWFLSNGTLAVSINITDYISFADSIIPQVYKMKTFLEEILNVCEISKCHLRKINLWIFENIQEGATSEYIQNLILSKDLLDEEKDTNFTKQEEEIENLNKVHFKDNSKDIIIKYLHMDGPKENSLGLFLDTEIIESDTIKTENINNTLLDQDKLLFNAFHWSVKQRIIDIMDGKEETI